MCRRMRARGEDITAAALADETGFPPNQTIVKLRRMVKAGLLYKAREIYGGGGRPRNVFGITHEGLTHKPTVYICGLEDLDD